VKRIFSLLSFLLLFIFIFKPTTYAAVQKCGDIDPTGIENNYTGDITISNSHSLVPNASYQVYMGDNGLLPDKVFGIFQYTNSKYIFNIRLSPDLYGPGNKNFYLKRVNNGTAAENPICMISLSVFDPRSVPSGICQAKINVERPKLTDNLSVTITGLSSSKDALRSVFLSRRDLDGNNGQIVGEKSKCVSDSELSSEGYELGTLEAGQYSVDVKEGCRYNILHLGYDPDLYSNLLCRVPPFTVTESGGSTTGQDCSANPEICQDGTACLPNVGPNAQGSSCQATNITLPNTFNSPWPALAAIQMSPCAQNAIKNQKCTSVLSAFGAIPTDAPGLISKLLQIMLAISGVVALIFIIVSGYRFMLSQGNPEAVQEARESLTSAIVGLLFIIFALVILQLITVNILHIPGFNP